jgi:hypothetical protein
MKNTGLFPVFPPLGLKFGKWKLLSALAHCKILCRLSQRLLIPGPGFLLVRAASKEEATLRWSPDDANTFNCYSERA